MNDTKLLHLNANLITFLPKPKGILTKLKSGHSQAANMGISMDIHHKLELLFRHLNDTFRSARQVIVDMPHGIEEVDQTRRHLLHFQEEYIVL